jgi:hypothetical protein
MRPAREIARRLDVGGLFQSRGRHLVRYNEVASRVDTAPATLIHLDQRNEYICTRTRARKRVGCFAAW